MGDAVIQHRVHDLDVVNIAPLAELVPGFEVANHEAAVGGDSPFVDLVDDGEEFPRLSLAGDTAAPDPLEELEER